MEMTMKPWSKWADRAVSVKMLMPLLDHKRLISACKLLGMRKFPDFQAD
jgi:hypothetical protein